MILVNLRQSTTPASTAIEIRDAAASAWANVSDSAMDQYGDYVLAVRDNVVTGVFSLRNWERLDDGRVEFTLDAAPAELDGLVGGDSPLRWKRGQANPVMYLETPDRMEDLTTASPSDSPTRRPAHARRRTHRITIETRGLSDDAAADLHHALITMARMTGRVHTFRTTSLVGEMEDAKARSDYSYESAPSPSAI